MNLYIHGNCQSWVMACMLAEVFDSWKITYFEIHAQPIIERNEDYHDAVASADLIFSQPVHEKYRERDDLSLSWVRQNSKPSAELIVFPSMHFIGHHPGIANLGIDLDLAQDAAAALLWASGVDDSQVARRILDPEFMSDDLIKCFIEQSITEMRRREVDDQIDVPLSPLVEEEAYSGQMFHIVNHPMRGVYVYLLNAILHRLGLPQRIAMGREDYQPQPHIPASPAISRFLAKGGVRKGTEGITHGDLVVLPGHLPMSLEDFYRDMLLQLHQMEPARVIAALSQTGWVRDFVRQWASSTNEAASLLSSNVRQAFDLPFGSNH